MTFSSPSKALLLLITDKSVQLLKWHGRNLTLIRMFGYGPEDLENFSAELPGYADFPVIILSDLIEENFRHDTIVHVNGSDHAALIKRKLDFAFRNTSYRLGKITGRQTDGRRDDLLMLSAITKPDKLDIWVNLLVEQKFAIQGITSVAHLLSAFVPINKLEHEPYLLIINLDEDNNLRQTFVKDGQILFSRLTKLPVRESNQAGNDVYLETLQIRQYFERIQFVPYETPLRIQVYAPHGENILQLEARNNETNHFEVVDVRSRLSGMQAEPEKIPAHPIYFFLDQVLSRQCPENVYACAAVRKYYDLKALSRYTGVAAATLMTLVLLMNMPAALKIRNGWQELDVLNSQIFPLQTEYRQLSQRFPATPIPSAEMELLVVTHDAIQRQVHYPPDTFNMISQAFARSPGLLLTSISWRLSEKAGSAFGKDTYEFNGNSQPQPNLAESGKFLENVLKGATSIEIRINGEAYSPDSFRDAQEQVLAFVQALSANPGVDVFASRMPTDVRTDIRVSTTVNDSEVRAPFTLELLMGEATQ